MNFYQTDIVLADFKTNKIRSCLIWGLILFDQFYKLSHTDLCKIAFLHQII